MSDTSRAEDLRALCQACGACCSGAVFGFVEIGPGELAEPTRRRLRVFREAGGERFKQPCPALEGNACAVYADRPANCRDYVCDVYVEHEQSGGDLQERLRIVRRIRELIDKIRARADERAGGWLPAPIAEIVQWDASRMGELRESVGEETLLDIAELGMRVRRDLGHVRKPS